MKFNRHKNLEGHHAFLSASKYHWINYDENKLIDYYGKYIAKMRGTELHDIAAKLIKHGIKQPKKKDTFSMFVNDAIGYKMTPEQPLYYSDNCFGTADAICFRNNLLRIHDLKTGVTPADMRQLLIYAALFCLEYKIRPGEIHIELRVYQNNEVVFMKPTAEDILPIMDTIQRYSDIITNIKEQEM